MRTWPRRIGGAVALGLAWAVVWAPVAVLIGVGIVDPDNSMDEMWVAVGAYPGFLSGALFFVALGAAGGGRGLAASSRARVLALGGASGLLVGALPLVIGTPSTALPLWLWAAVVTGGITLLSAVSAALSAWVARRAETRRAAA